jgi:predicted Zn finger-like uncharacterized protein
MAVEARCPSCGAGFSLRDDMQGKKVRCAKCEEVFSVGGPRPPDDKQGVKASRAADDDDRSASRKARAPAKRDRDDDEDDERRPRRRKRDEDEDDRPRRPGRRSSGGAGMVLAVVGGSVALLLLLCGGIACWIFYRASLAADEIQQAMNNPNNFQAAGGPPAGDPFLLQPQKINNIDDALRELKSADVRDRQSAANWLARAPLDAGRQREVGLALDPLLAEPDVNSRYAAMRALKTWAVADNVPSLVKALNEQKLDGVPNDATKDAMSALGRLKDARGAEPVARFLTNLFSREAAAGALQQMGPVAEKAVLSYYHHRDGGVREKARSLVQGYGTRDSAVIAQSEADVRQATERDTRREAARWLKTARVDPQQQSAVASTLAAALADADNDVADAAMDALDTWATAETVPALVKLVENPAAGGRVDHMRRRAMALLGKLKDVRGAEPVAARLPTGGDRRLAGDALIAMGPVAKAAVEKYATHRDQAVRREVERILASYGADTGGLKLTQLLADLASPEARRRSDAARTLATMKVDAAQQEKVARALETATSDTSDKGAQELALKALGVWGTKANGPALVKIIGDKDKQPAHVRHAAMDLLARWKDEEAIKAIALNIGPDKGDREAAAKALIAMGPELGNKIEAVVSAGLTSPDKAIVLECVKVIGAVGTRASVAELNRLGQLAVKQKQRDVEAACRKALTDIALRGK